MATQHFKPGTLLCPADKDKVLVVFRSSPAHLLGHVRLETYDNALNMWDGLTLEVTREVEYIGQGLVRFGDLVATVSSLDSPHLALANDGLDGDSN